MSYMRQAKQNADNEAAAQQLASMQRDAERAGIADAAKLEGVNQGFQHGVQEGTNTTLAGIKEALQGLFGQRRQQPQQSQGLAGQFDRQAQAQRREMEQYATQRALQQAKEMGNTSDDNINILIDRNLRELGL